MHNTVHTRWAQHDVAPDTIVRGFFIFHAHINLKKEFTFDLRNKISMMLSTKAILSIPTYESIFTLKPKAL